MNSTKATPSWIKGYEQFADKVYLIIELICKLLFVSMAVSISYAVFGRFVLRSVPNWCEEFGILCMVWICFLSTTLAIRNGTHIRMTILEYVFPEIMCKALHFLSYIVILTLSVCWIIYGYAVIELTIIPKMPSTQLSMAWLYGSVAVSAISAVIMSISRLLRGEW